MFITMTPQLSTAEILNTTSDGNQGQSVVDRDMLLEVIDIPVCGGDGPEGMEAI